MEKHKQVNLQLWGQLWNLFWSKLRGRIVNQIEGDLGKQLREPLINNSRQAVTLALMSDDWQDDGGR